MQNLGFLTAGLMIDLLGLVFHRILDFTKGRAFYPSPFLLCAPGKGINLEMGNSYMAKRVAWLRVSCSFCLVMLSDPKQYQADIYV
jgi:hypothetical protein